MSEVRVRLTKCDDVLCASSQPMTPVDATHEAPFGYDWIHGGIGWRPRRTAPVVWLRCPLRFYWLLVVGCGEDWGRVG